MKILATLFLILIFEFSSGQGFNCPSIKPKRNSIHDFVPKGWTILKSTKGDLNSDKYNDIALVLQHRDSVSLIKDEDDFSDTVITQLSSHYRRKFSFLIKLLVTEFSFSR